MKMKYQSEKLQPNKELNLTKITIFIGEILRNNVEIRGFTKDFFKEYCEY